MRRRKKADSRAPDTLELVEDGPLTDEEQGLAESAAPNDEISSASDAEGSLAGGDDDDGQEEGEGELLGDARRAASSGDQERDRHDKAFLARGRDRVCLCVCVEFFAPLLSPAPTYGCVSETQN